MRTTKQTMKTMTRSQTRKALGLHCLVPMLCAALFASAISTRAADIVWINTAGGNWNATANWSPSIVPGTNDVALITNAGSYTVTVNVSPTIAGLTLGGDSGTQTLALASFNLTLNGSGGIGTNGVFNFSGGTFGGTNILAVNGTVNWSGGTLNPYAVMQVASNGAVALSGSAAKSLDGAITNAGIIIWSGAGFLNLEGVLHNLPGGLFDAQNDALVDFTAGTPIFINDGTFRKSAGTGLTRIQPPFINNGTVDAQTGTIRFDQQPVTLNAGCRFLGAGINLLYFVTATLAGEIKSENLVLQGATLTGTGALSGTLTWADGTLNAAANLTVATDGILVLNSGNDKNMNGTITNAGIMRWTDSGSLDLEGTIHNLPGGLFDAQNNAVLYSIGTPLFINDGTVRKSAGTGNTRIQPPFINNGTVDAQTGTIRFDQQPVTLNAGCRFLGAGINLLYFVTATLAGEIESENLVLQGATLAGTGTLSGTLTWESGTLNGLGNLTIATNGTLSLASASIKTLEGVITNAGLITWTDAGTLNLEGVLHNLPGGLFDAQDDALVDFTVGTPLFINDGTFRKSAGTGLTRIQPPFINNGTVDAQTGTIRFDQQPVTLNAGCRFLGAGINQLYFGVTATLAGEIESENLVLQGATLAGTGGVNGSFIWNSGTLSPDVSFNVPTNGLLVFASAGIKTLNGNITNAGVVTWSGTGDLLLRGTIHNLASGLFDAQNSEILDYDTGSPLIVNDGTFRKSAGAGLTHIQPAFINNGTVDAQTGTIRFELQPVTLNAGCRLLGAGTNQLYFGVTATLAGEIESENLTLAGASLTGAGGINGSFIWNSGTLTPDVSFNIRTNGQLLLASTGSKNLNGTITNAGVVTWTGTGDLIVKGVIHNLPTGLFDARNDEVLDFVSGTPVMVNEGVFRKSAGAGTTQCQIPFSNLGTVEVNSGTLRFSGSYTNPGGTIALGGGTLQTVQPIQLFGGRLTGAGTVLNSVANDGLVSPAGSNGVLTVTGNYTQTLDAEAEFELGGTSAGTNHSQLRVTGQANLNGTISVKLAGAYLPNPADAFPVMTFASRTGAFRCFNGFFLLGHDERLSLGYQPTNATLVAQSAPDPTGAVLNISRDNQVIVCWPREFTGFNLQGTTNLTTTNWVAVPVLTTNRYLELPVLPEKYFRLIQ